jgi:hypothetical protein
VTRGGATVHAASYRYPIGDLEVDQLLGP